MYLSAVFAGVGGVSGAEELAAQHRRRIVGHQLLEKWRKQNRKVREKPEASSSKNNELMRSFKFERSPT
jgi:hypothetical protein